MEYAIILYTLLGIEMLKRSIPWVLLICVIFGAGFAAASFL
jgi:ABC-type enterochelin transport system permease subunit